MKSILILLVSLIAAVSLASAYTAEQQNMIDGTQLSWKMAVAYTNKDTATFNALADQWNAWVYKNFGQDANMLMNKLTGPVDLQKPYLLANNTTRGGIVHSIDGSFNESSKYTTNDMNLLPNSVTQNMYDRAQQLEKEGKTDTPEYLATQGNYLGGV